MIEKCYFRNSKDFIWFSVIMQSDSHPNPKYTDGVRLQSTEDRDIKFNHMCFSNKTYVFFTHWTESIKKSQRLPFELTVRFSVHLMFIIQWVPIWVTFLQQQQQQLQHPSCLSCEIEIFQICLRWVYDRFSVVIFLPTFILTIFSLNQNRIGNNYGE